MEKQEFIKKLADEGKSIKATIRENFPHLTDDDFDTHESDLYVRSYPGIAKLIRSKGIRFDYFISQIDKQAWLNLPFQNEMFWKRKCGSYPIST